MNLQRDLGEDYDVLLPQMPKSSDAKYNEWRIYFEKIIPLLDEDVIFIGHSLGGIFLAKYLAKHLPIKVNVKALILIAAPYDDEEEESLGNFTLKGWDKLLSLTKQKVWLLFSKDDPVVPFGELEKYQKAIPGSLGVVFEDKGHFNWDTFPELVTLIKTI